MANTFDVGRLFFDLINVRGGPPVHFGKSQEIEKPFRHSRVVVFRLFPLRKGLVVGWWRSSGLTEEQALTRALQAWGIDLYKDSRALEDPDVRAYIRDNVARATETVEDEWLIVDTLGLDR